MKALMSRIRTALMGKNAPIQADFKSEEKIPDVTHFGTEADYTIDNAWRDHFAPATRKLGFKGSGRHFRRVEEGFIQTVNLQGSQMGGKFAVNLGLQPLNIPDVIGRDVDVKSIKEMECVFRNRLSADGCDTWWSYSRDPQQMAQAAKDAADLFLLKAEEYFAERSQFALNVKPHECGGGMVSLFVSLALLRERQGNIRDAKAFAELAVAKGSSPYWKGYSPIKHLLNA